MSVERQRAKVLLTRAAKLSEANWRIVAGRHLLGDCRTGLPTRLSIVRQSIVVYVIVRLLLVDCPLSARMARSRVTVCLSGELRLPSLAARFQRAIGLKTPEHFESAASERHTERQHNEAKTVTQRGHF